MAPVIVGVLLTCQSLDPKYKTTAFFFQMYFQEKNIVLYSGQYCIFVSFLVKISNKSRYFIDKQNDLRYLVLFPGEKLSAFWLKQLKLSTSGVINIFLKQEYFTYPTG